MLSFPSGARCLFKDSLPRSREDSQGFLDHLNRQLGLLLQGTCTNFEHATLFAIIVLQQNDALHRVGFRFKGISIHEIDLKKTRAVFNDQVELPALELVGVELLEVVKDGEEGVRK